MNKTIEGFEAMGKPVPSNRVQKAYNTLKQIIPNESTELYYSIVMKCVRLIENDKCVSIVGDVSNLDKDISKLDLTARYRLLAVLLTD